MVRREREISEEVQHRSYPDKPSSAQPPSMGRLRPQIALGILCATVFSCLGLWIGLQLEAVEVITAIIGGLFGFLGGVSLKVLENE